MGTERDREMSAVVGSDDTSVFVCASKLMVDILELVDNVSESDCCVVIEGESGTGKELIARRLHFNSPRSEKPFIPVNCAGISETLFESQFFGHVRGAFTGAEKSMLGLVRSAEGGTLFMDEIGEIPPNIQAKLLRVLQEGEVMAVGTTEPVAVNTRFIAATNRNLLQDVQNKKFREDLYYRLNVVRIHLPPLRERKEDIPVLLDHFLAKQADCHKVPAIEISRNVQQKLCEYDWPGNVRELASWVERLYATKLAPEVLISSMQLHVKNDELNIKTPTRLMSLEEAERFAIEAAMNASDNNRSQAASILGINRGTLLRKIARFETN